LLRHGGARRIALVDRIGTAAARMIGGEGRQQRQAHGSAREQRGVFDELTAGEFIFYAELLHSITSISIL
jgi:hypothetical protein